MRFLERRVTPADSPLAMTAAMVIAAVVAMLVTSLLFGVYKANPLQAYFALFHEPFASWRGFGYTLVRTAPLTLIALGTIVSWRSGFGYLGFEGCFVIGAAATTWLALAMTLPFWTFLPLALLLSFAAGAAWAGIVALIRARFGGNEVLISLMMNYVAILIVQYLVSGPMRAPWRRARDISTAPRHVAALYLAWNARSRRHPARVVGSVVGVGVAGQDPDRL